MRCLSVVGSVMPCVLLISVAACTAGSDDGSSAGASVSVTTTATALESSTELVTTVADPVTSPPSSSVSPTSSPTTTTSTSSTTTSTTVSPAPVVSFPIEVVDSAFLGIGQGTLLPDGLATLPQLGEPFEVDEPDFLACANLQLPRRWVARFDGLSTLWEGESFETAVLTNWMYSGALEDGVPQMAGSQGVTVGSNRADVLAAYPAAFDAGDMVYPDNTAWRFTMDGDTIASFGVIDCGD